jgi:hypothetical protein
MKYLFAIVLLIGFIITPAFAQETKNPSLVTDMIEIPADEFNVVLRDTSIVKLDDIHAISWQVTIDNNLIYSNPDGTAVLRLYDSGKNDLIEIGMGPQPNSKLWVAVTTPKEGYIVVHKNFERGWYPETKLIISYTDKAGLTVNNGARIVVTNLDIGTFAIDSYSVHGMESSTDPPAVNSGSMIIDILSGDPSKNIFAYFPFYMAIGVGIIVAVLFLTKKRT